MTFKCSLVLGMREGLECYKANRYLPVGKCLMKKGGKLERRYSPAQGLSELGGLSF